MYTLIPNSNVSIHASLLNLVIPLPIFQETPHCTTHSLTLSIHYLFLTPLETQPPASLAKDTSARADSRTKVRPKHMPRVLPFFGILPPSSRKNAGRPTSAFKGKNRAKKKETAPLKLKHESRKKKSSSSSKEVGIGAKRKSWHWHSLSRARDFL